MRDISFALASLALLSACAGRSTSAVGAGGSRQASGDGGAPSAGAAAMGGAATGGPLEGPQPYSCRYHGDCDDGICVAGMCTDQIACVYENGPLDNPCMATVAECSQCQIAALALDGSCSTSCVDLDACTSLDSCAACDEVGELCVRWRTDAGVEYRCLPDPGCDDDGACTCGAACGPSRCSTLQADRAWSDGAIVECGTGMIWDCSPENCPSPRRCVANACVNGSECRPSAVQCAKLAPDASCPLGQTNSIVGGCWGPCVDVASCDYLDTCEICAANQQYCAELASVVGIQYRCVAPVEVCDPPSCRCMGQIACGTEICESFEAATFECRIVDENF